MKVQYLALPWLYVIDRIKEAQSEKYKEEKALYGEATPAPPPVWMMGVVMLLVLLVVGGLWIYPMVKAFSCPYNGVLWGVLILLFWPLGIVYLIMGCKPPVEAAPAVIARRHACDIVA
jgi:hypothetical protein